MRRIVHYPPHVQYSDVSSLITPAWHQWLRHTRSAAPTLAEQELDLVRQRRVKVLAAQADERWEAKGRLVDGPGVRQPRPGLGTSDATIEGQPRPGEGRPETWTGTAGETGVDGEELASRGGATKEGQKDSKAAEKMATGTAWSGQELLDREAERMRVDGGPAPKVFTNPGRQARKEIASSPPPKEDPWKKARGGPSEDWQPQAWNPGQVERR
jgi:NADH dehydrogenase [ubiquinone] 1 alpha subcomplex assembly factor 2